LEILSEASLLEILNDLASITVLDHHCHAFEIRTAPYTALE
jgi:hypothetical protein